MRSLVDRPTDLKDVLQRHGAELSAHARAFYIIEPRLEKNSIIKFGVAGMGSGNAYSRLNEYRILYGETKKGNECQGVIVHYIGITAYDRLVRAEHTQVYKLEQHLKKTYKSITEKTHRGTERVPKTKLPEIMDEIRRKKFNDVATVLRATNREATRKHQTDHKAYVHTKPRRVTRTAVSQK